MNNQKDKESLSEKERRALPLFVEFIKFSAAFAIIIMTALVALQVASEAL